MRNIFQLSYCCIPVVFVLLTAECTNYPQIDTINITSDCEITWEKNTDCRVSAGGQNIPAKSHLRGGFTSRYPKHNYAIKTETTIELCGMPADRRWVLCGSYIDKTFLRHKISFDLFREMSTRDVSPLCNYANLTLNGEDQGLYVVMQRMTAQTIGLNINDSNAFLFKEPPVFRTDIQELPQPEEKTWSQKFPKKKERNHYNKILELYRFLHSPNSLFYSRVGDIFDLQNIMDWQILMMFSNNADGLLKNFFLYKIDGGTPLRIAIWDCDHSFGRDGDGELNMLTANTDPNRNLLLRRLMQLPEYRQAVAHRWFELRDCGLFDETNINLRINNEANKIRTATERNFELWPVESDYYYDQMGFDEELDIIRQFLHLSLPRMDSIMKSYLTSSKVIEA